MSVIPVIVDAWNGSQKIGKWAEGVGNRRENQDHPDYSILEIEKSTEKSQGDLRRLAVTQTPVKTIS